MLRLDVSFDTSILDAERQRYEKNLAYSVAQALNDTALEAQKRIRAHLREVFVIRKPDFMDRSIKMFAFANVKADRPYAELGVDQKSRLLLSMLEVGGTRPAFKGRSTAVPITGGAARPGIADSVLAGYQFNALNFVQRGTVPPQTTGGGFSGKRRRAKGAKSWKGNQRTFILDHTRKLPYGGVFQRTGPKRADIRLVYVFRRNVQLRATLGFIALAAASFNQTFRDAFVRRFYRLRR
jgi:hypothetical protein